MTDWPRPSLNIISRKGKIGVLLFHPLAATPKFFGTMPKNFTQFEYDSALLLSRASLHKVMAFRRDNYNREVIKR